MKYVVIHQLLKNTIMAFFIKTKVLVKDLLVDASDTPGGHRFPTSGLAPDFIF